METPLRKIRRLKRYTLSDVAEKTGVEVGNLSRVERGKQNASPDVAEKLSRFYHRKISEMEILYPERYPTNERRQKNRNVKEAA